MAEYIERDKAIDYLMEILDRPNHAEFLWTDEICSSLNSIPAADVRPVVRGKWVLFEEDVFSNSYECSVCHEPQMLFGGTPKDNKYNFCPTCGAMMEES